MLTRWLRRIFGFEDGMAGLREVQPVLVEAIQYERDPWADHPPYCKCYHHR